MTVTWGSESFQLLPHQTQPIQPTLELIAGFNCIQRILKERPAFQAEFDVLFGGQ